jgi:hypothetical protein
MTAKTAPMAEVTTLYTSSAEIAKNAPKAAASMFGALFAASRATVAGVIEVDRALIGYARDAVTNYIDLGKKTVQARNLNDLLNLHVASAHARVENTAANAREIVELSRQKLQEAYAPVKEVVETYRGSKTA